jgi:hypothetical protein
MVKRQIPRRPKEKATRRIQLSASRRQQPQESFLRQLLSNVEAINDRRNTPADCVRMFPKE